MLSDIIFSDLFVADNAAESWYKATPDSLKTQPVPQDCYAEVDKLREKLIKLSEKSSFKFSWPDEGGLMMRAERVQVSGDKTILVCRRYRLLPGKLTSLGMPAAVAEKLLGPDLTDGLVVFFGKAGSGKTTTAASFIKERLEKFGGVCWTIENPIELPMQGKHGEGVCYQTEIDSDSEMGPAIPKLYRLTPNIIFIGELRDKESIREALVASTSGHLVVATFHAQDLGSGIARLARMAGEESSNEALSDALRVGIHLKLYNASERPLIGAFTSAEVRGTGTPPRVLSVEPIFISGTGTEALKSIIRKGEFQLLKSEIETQRRNFMNKSRN